MHVEQLGDGSGYGDEPAADESAANESATAEGWVTSGTHGQGLHGPHSARTNSSTLRDVGR